MYSRLGSLSLFWLIAVGVGLAAQSLAQDAPPKSSDSAAAAFERAYAAHLKGQLDNAIADYTEALRLDPKHARALNNRGLAYQAKRDWDRAIADFTQAIQLAPDLSAGYTNRGMAYAEKDDFGRALADYNEAIRIDPAASKVYKLRAAVHAARGDRANMAADLVRAAKNYRPKYDTVAHKAVAAELELKTKDYLPDYDVLDSIIDEAKARIVPKKSYGEHDALEVLQIIDGILLRRRFITTDQTLTCDTLKPHAFTQNLIDRMDPQTLRFRPRPGEIFHLSTPLTDTLIYAAIGEVLGLPIDVALTPGNAFVKWRLADSSHINWDTTIGLIRPDAEYVARLQISKAMLQNGVYLKPVPADHLLASVYHRIGMAWGGEWRGLENEFKDKDPEKDPVRTRKAIDALTKALDHNTKAFQTLIQRGQYWVRITEYEKAIDDNTLALELDPDQPAGYFGRGLALLTRGDAQKAIGDFDKALSLDPNLPTSYYFRGLARAQIKQPNRAMEDLNKAIDLEPRFIVAYQARAKVWEVLGRNDKARNDDDRAAALMGKKP